MTGSISFAYTREMRIHQKHQASLIASQKYQQLTQ